MKNELAPIVLFAYNRPWHVKQTLESLAKNHEAADSELFIYVDGSKNDASIEDIEKNNEVKKVIREKKWCKNVTIIESEINKGLANSVINGLNKTFEVYDTVIVIEDDVLVSPFFLKFMNDSLSFYKNENKVLSIGSWNYFTNPNSLSKNFFMNMPDTIAWATWKRAWSLFDADGKKLHQQLQNKRLIETFNLNNRFNFESMLIAQTKGMVSSWAIRWTAIAVLNKTLTLYPYKSLSKHIGFGDDSTNCEGDDYNKNLELSKHKIDVSNIPLEQSKQAVNSWVFIEKNIKKSGLIIHSKSFKQRILDFIKNTN